MLVSVNCRKKFLCKVVNVSNGLLGCHGKQSVEERKVNLRLGRIRGKELCGLRAESLIAESHKLSKTREEKRESLGSKLTNRYERESVAHALIHLCGP